MAGVYDIVMSNRKELVDTLIKNMEKGYIWTENAWNSAALRPYNPASECYYLGGNRARLMLAAIENSYDDPRWCTYKQAQANGWAVKRGAQSVLLEKWIFTETKTVENEFGEPEKVTVELDTPKVNYFRVFNASQIHGIPKLEALPDPEYDSIIEAATRSSKCPIEEKAVSRACYIPDQDIIEIPPRFSFKSAESYLSVQIHEMCHSTGHADRLNRSLLNTFGSPDYAREELRAELGAAFFKANLNLPLSNEQLQDHSNYLASWIKVLEDDPNEFFRACKDAEKISDYLQKNYEQTLEAQKENIIEKTAQVSSDIEEYKEIMKNLAESEAYVNDLKHEMLNLEPDDVDYQAIKYELVKSAEVQLKNAQNEYASFLQIHPEYMDFSLEHLEHKNLQDPDKIRLFIDMDGTLTEFIPQTSTAPLYQQGYFAELPPHENVIAAIKEIIENHPEIEVNILSAYLTDSKYALEEKDQWLDKYLPEVDKEHRIFVPNGSNKKEFIGQLTKNDFLLDDYTPNLTKWLPGRGIKLLNAINHTRGTWQYDRIRFDREPADLAKGIVNIVKNHEHVYDKSVHESVKKYFTVNINSDSIPTFYNSLDDALKEYFQEETAQNVFGSDSRTLGAFMDDKSYIPFLERQYGVDIVNPEHIENAALKSDIDSVQKALQEFRDPSETYMDRINRQFLLREFPITESLEKNLMELHEITGEEYYLNDLAKVPRYGVTHEIDFGSGQEIANEIYSECRAIELEQMQELMADMEMEAGL